MKKIATILFLVATALSTSACSIGTENATQPSPSSQAVPINPTTPTVISEQEIESSPQNLNFEEEYLNDPKFIQIEEKVNQGNNESRFNKLSTLIESNFITKVEADRIYTLIEQGSTGELSYQLYLYELNQTNTK